MIGTRLILAVQEIIEIHNNNVVCVILCLAILIQYRHAACDTQTDTHRHMMMANTRASLVPCG